MYKDIDDGSVDFVRTMHELFRQQGEAVEGCRYSTIRHLGNQLKRLLPSLTRIIKACKGDESSRAKEIIALAHEIRELQRDSTGKMIRERDRLARMLHDIKKGRMMLVKYRADNSVKQIFEMQG